MTKKAIFAGKKLIYICEFDDEAILFDPLKFIALDKEVIVDARGNYCLQDDYKSLRVAEYPSVAEQMDMQYWDTINGTTVWKNTIDAIKSKYPKS